MPLKSPYSVHPGVAYIQNILANFKTKTGRTVEEWIAFVNKEGPKTEVERRTKGNRITHRIPIESIDQVDAFVERVGEDGL